MREGLDDSGGLPGLTREAGGVDDDAGEGQLADFVVKGDRV